MKCAKHMQSGKIFPYSASLHAGYAGFVSLTSELRIIDYINKNGTDIPTAKKINVSMVMEVSLATDTVGIRMLLP